ncbi:hypothetical protein HGB25_01485 [Candidatus Saccharibacteria bacterium]|nr:hypothetical protein [Candidatus Saccharibacteria bacterium]
MVEINISDNDESTDASDQYSAPSNGSVNALPEVDPNYRVEPVFEFKKPSNKKKYLFIGLTSVLVLLIVVAAILFTSATGINEKMSKARTVSSQVNSLISTNNSKIFEYKALYKSAISSPVKDSSAVSSLVANNSEQSKNVDAIISKLKEEVGIYKEAQTIIAPDWYKKYLSDLQDAVSLKVSSYEKEKDRLALDVSALNVISAMTPSNSTVTSLRTSIESKNWSVAKSQAKQLLANCLAIEKITDSGLKCDQVMSSEISAVTNQDTNLSAKYWFDVSALFNNDVTDASQFYLKGASDKTYILDKQSQDLDTQSIAKRKEANNFYNNGGNTFTGKIFVELEKRFF